MCWATHGQSGYIEKALEAGSQEEGYQVSWVSGEVAEKQSLQCLRLGSLLKTEGNLGRVKEKKR